MGIKIQKLSLLAAPLLVSAGMVAVVAGNDASATVASSCTWQPASDYSGLVSWTEADHWDCTSGTVPVDNSEVIFPEGAQASGSWYSLDPNESSPYLKRVVLGQSLSLNNGANLRLSDGAEITVASGASASDVAVTSSGVISGQGDLSISVGTDSAEEVLFSVVGAMTVKASASVNTLAASTFGEGIFVDSDSRVIYRSGSATNTIAYPIYLSGGSGLTFGTVWSCTSCGDGIEYNATGIVTVETGKTAGISVQSNVVARIENAIAGGEIIKGYGAGELYVQSVAITSSDLTGTTDSDQPKSTKLDGEKPDEAVYVNNKETATLSGTRGATTVDNGGALKGEGTIQSLNVLGTVAPGNSPGTIHVVESFSLNEAGTYQAEVMSVDDHDKVIANTVTLAGTLELSFLDGATVAEGDSYTLIDNAGDDAVDGTFKDLPEGATFNAQGGTFKISYVGGDGNDVVVTVMGVPDVPNTGFMKLQASPAVIALATVVASAALLVIARRVKATA